VGLEKTRFLSQGFPDGEVVVDVTLAAIDHGHVADPEGDDAIKEHVGSISTWRVWKENVSLFSRMVRLLSMSRWPPRLTTAT